jgi:hypothetical protein
VTSGVPGSVTVTAVLLPYGPTHQTFLNFYECGAFTSQVILDRIHPQLEYFVAPRQGVFAVIRKFVMAGIHQLLIGPDHLLFLIGLPLLGGSIRQLLLVLTSFTVAHSITLSGYANPMPDRLGTNVDIVYGELNAAGSKWTWRHSW